jgi:MFS family permease
VSLVKEDELNDRQKEGPVAKNNYRWVVLLVATVTQTTTSLVTQGVPTLAPFFQEEFFLSRSLVGMVAVSLNIGALLTLAIAGRAVDRFGERWVIGVGGTFIGLMSMGMIFINSFYLLLIIILILGLGISTSTPAGSKSVMTWFPENQRGMAMGIRQTGIPLGGVVAALVLPPVAIGYGWRLALHVAGVFTILGAIIYCIFYKESLARSEERSEKKVSKALPLSPRLLLANHSFLSVSILSVILVVSQFSIVTYLILFLVETLNYPLILASSLLAAAQLTGVFGRIIWGMISDKFFQGSRKKVLMLITMVSGGMSFSMSLITFNSPVWLVGLVIALIGFSAIGWNGLFITLISELVDQEHAGTAVGLAMTITQVGIILGPPLFGLVVDLTSSYRLAWLGLSGLLWLSLVLFKYIQEPIKERVKVKSAKKEKTIDVF